MRYVCTSSTDHCNGQYKSQWSEKTYSKELRQKIHRPAFHTLLPLQPVQSSHVFQIWIFCPRPNWYSQFFLVHINESSLSHTVRWFVCNAKGLAESVTSREWYSSPLFKDGSITSSVERFWYNTLLKLFYPTTWFEVSDSQQHFIEDTGNPLVCFCIESIPICYATVQESNMDIIKFLAETPRLTTVAYFELEVRWNPIRLNGRQVSTDDSSAWVLISKVTATRQDRIAVLWATDIAQIPVPVPISRTRYQISRNLRRAMHLHRPALRLVPDTACLREEHYTSDGSNPGVPVIAHRSDPCIISDVNHEIGGITNMIQLCMHDTFCHFHTDSRICYFESKSIRFELSVTPWKRFSPYDWLSDSP